MADRPTEFTRHLLPVAQTVLNAAHDPDFVQFDRETAIQARISRHPNIVAYKGVCKVTCSLRRPCTWLVCGSVRVWRGRS